MLGDGTGRDGVDDTELLADSSLMERWRLVSNRGGAASFGGGEERGEFRQSILR